MTESYPRLAARTMTFTLGIPRSFTVSPDGSRVVFLRADGPTTRTHSLWVYDVETGEERRVVDAAGLLSEAAEELTQEERARRERMRVSTSGVVAYSTDKDVTRAAFALSSRLFVVELVGDPDPRELAVTAAVIDPHIDPTGQRVAYAGDRALHVVDLDGSGDRVLVGPRDDEPAEVSWGMAEFAAAEELGRARGFWWAPDGEWLVVERCDETPVLVWHISDPLHPERPPVRQRYPQCGTANAIVSLALVDLDGRCTAVDWCSDSETEGVVLEYLADVRWVGDAPLLTLLTRDQRRLEYRRVDPATGATTLLRAFTDEQFVEPLPGTPQALDDGRIVAFLDDGDTERLAVDGAGFTPDGVQVRELLAADDTGVFAVVSPSVATIAVARLGYDGSITLLSDAGGVALGAVGGGTVVVQQRTLDDVGVRVSVTSRDAEPGSIACLNDRPPLRPNAETMQVGSRDYPTTLLWPTGHERGSRRLPVLMDPYGGPHGQRVMNSAQAYLASQWYADQGFLVIVADGRGMAGRGPAWDRLAYHDFIGTIDDQAEVLLEIAARYPDDVDTSKVAIRGWSFGGYIALAGVLTRPDVFAAAVAGAPVSDQRLYDTCYSERYLGHPDTDKDVYDANDLTLLADRLTKPLMMIHGLADDNVAIAHTLKMSQALLEHGKPHEVLPLSGITHMANSEAVAENLALFQLAFLRRALAIEQPVETS